MMKAIMEANQRIWLENVFLTCESASKEPLYHTFHGSPEFKNICLTSLDIHALNAHSEIIHSLNSVVHFKSLNYVASSKIKIFIKKKKKKHLSGRVD